MKYLIIWVTMLPLVLAAIVYTAYRGDCCYAGAFLAQLIGENAALQYMSSTQNAISLSETNIYSLPSAMWVFSTTFISSRIVSQKPNSWKFLVLFPVLYAVVLEAMQFYTLTDGTYDPNDILYAILGWTTAIIFSNAFDLSDRSVQFPSSVLAGFYAILILANGV